LLAAALLALVQLQPTAYSAGPTPFFDSGEIEAVSFVGDGTNAVTQEPVPPAKNNEQAATLFDMDTEPVTEGELLKKWSHAKAKMAQELQTVDRCRANNSCPAVAQRLKLPVTLATLELTATGLWPFIHELSCAE